jgi:hypothetical protein
LAAESPAVMRGFFMGVDWAAIGCGFWLLAVGCWLGKKLFRAQKQNPICFRKWGFGI